MRKPQEQERQNRKKEQQQTNIVAKVNNIHAIKLLNKVI